MPHVTGGEPKLDLAWGAKEIAHEIGRSVRQTYYLLACGAISVARKVGDTWVADRQALRREFRVGTAASDVARQG